MDNFVDNNEKVKNDASVVDTNTNDLDTADDSKISGTSENAIENNFVADTSSSTTNANDSGIADSSRKVSSTLKKMSKKVYKFSLEKLRLSILDSIGILQQNSKSIVFIFFTAFLLMTCVAIATFFIFVKGAEKVMVPNIVGKSLTEALLEMQVKELYPKIQLRYSELPGDEGKILEQNPQAGTIVKAGKRVSLIVSKGIIIDHVEDYVGLILDDVKIQLQTLFAGSTNPLIVLAEPVFKADVSNPGTILEQTPAPNTIITEPVTVSLVVSRGPEFENTRVRNVVGKTISQMLDMMRNGKIVYDFTYRFANEDEKAGVIVQQEKKDSEFIPNYSRMKAEFALAKPTADTDTICGVLTENLTAYPYPVPMKVEVLTSDGDISTLIEFSHPGGLLTVPYEVQKNSTLILSIVNKEYKRIRAE